MDAHSTRIQALFATTEQVAAFVLTQFLSKNFAISRKVDGSEVTNVDIEAERIARKTLLEQFPDDCFLGEESGGVAGTSGYRWVVDPIDGTASFARGVPLFGTLIGLEYENKPFAGMAVLPALGERISAVQGQGAMHNGAPAKMSEVSTLQNAMICTTSFDYYRQTGSESLHKKLMECAGSTRGWSDCYGYLLLCTGKIDGVVEPLLHPWDVIPWLPIITESGGQYSPIAQGGIASSAQLHNTLYHALHDDITN
ncbi:MAG: histidinol phosphate phosphatase [Phycisphaerae bacterium]|nr:histidinol phosphate phosphatase [Phycisphaerae bacterium]